MKISIVIPCRNEKRHIREFLDSVMSQSFDPEWEVEILVADGLSDDGTRDVIRQYIAEAPNVRLIDNPGRIVSTGLNAAIRASAGDIVVRMDAHTVYARDYIRQCIEVLRESGADNVGGPWKAQGEGYTGKAIAAAFQSPFCAGGGKSHNPNHEGEVDTVYLGCWRRSAFDRFGFFDSELVRNQDDEFNFRIRRQGGRILQSPRIQSTYTPRSSITSLFRQYMQYGYWKVAVIRKHRSLASWRHLVPALFLSSILLGLICVASFAAFGKLVPAGLIARFLSVEIAVYFLACIAATLPFTRSLNARALVAVPAVIAVYHVSYGLGFLLGLFRPAKPGTGRVATANAFTALTR